jgi:hypothetical protein
MVTYTNATKTKLVKVTLDAERNYHALYIQVYHGEEQVIEAKTFKNLNGAVSYSLKKLDI